jgi:aminoglycoside phosphotransferase family enzyme
MPELPELVQALLDPRAYPGPPRQVELLQTQISYVFKADDLVYKVKKPVDFGFLDYSTLDKRRGLCLKEVQLNRRLCPHAYLGVATVTRDGGRIVVDGTGDILEYAVKMQLLPRDRMMDVLLARDAVTPDMVRAVADKLAAFHARAAFDETIGEYGSLAMVTRTIDGVFVRDDLQIGTLIAPGVYQKLLDHEHDFLRDHAALFEKRVADGRIRDCHGDLHAQHICFCDDICIYDCIEFADYLRYIDVAADVAFLAMDLDRFGRRDLSRVFVETYVEHSGDQDLLTLLDFYKCYRAFVRYMVNCQQYADPHIPAAQREKVAALARTYAGLAASYVTG